LGIGLNASCSLCSRTQMINSEQSRAHGSPLIVGSGGARLKQHSTIQWPRPCQDPVLALRTHENLLFSIFLSSEGTGLWKSALTKTCNDTASGAWLHLTHGPWRMPLTSWLSKLQCYSHSPLPTLCPLRFPDPWHGSAETTANALTAAHSLTAIGRPGGMIAASHKRRVARSEHGPSIVPLPACRWPCNQHSRGRTNRSPPPSGNRLLS